MRGDIFMKKTSAKFISFPPKKIPSPIEIRAKGIKFLPLKYFIPRHASQNGTAVAGSFEMDWIGYADDLLFIFDDKTSLQRRFEAS